MDCWNCQIEPAITRAMTSLGIVADLCEACAATHGRRLKKPPLLPKANGTPSHGVPLQVLTLTRGEQCPVPF